MEMFGKQLLRMGKMRSAMKNLCLHVIILFSGQLKESDSCWMRHMSSGLHVGWK